MAHGRRNDEPLAQTTLAKRKLSQLRRAYATPAGGVVELSELLGRLRAAIGGTQLSDLSELINEALSHLDDDMARINAWKAVPSERLHGWTIDAATENYLRFFKPLELDKRHVVMFHVPEEFTVPTEEAIFFAAYKLLAFEKEISTSH